MHEIIRPLKLKITKKTVTVSTIVGTVPGLFLGEPKETRIWAFVCVIAAWISSTMRASPYATPAIHAVVVAWPSSPVDGASQKGARYARPSSTIFTLTIVDFMFTNTWRHFHTCAVHWLAEEPQPPAFTCKTCAMSEPKRWSTGLNTHIF